MGGVLSALNGPLDQIWCRIIYCYVVAAVTPDGERPPEAPDLPRCQA